MSSSKLSHEINEESCAIPSQGCGTLHEPASSAAHLREHGAAVVVGLGMGIQSPESPEPAIQSRGTLRVRTAQSAEIMSAIGPAPDYPTGVRPSRLESSALGHSTWVYLKQRNAWIQAELSRAREESITSISQEEKSDTVGVLCHVCASRGAFTICPQMLSTDTNPRIHIDDAIDATLFAKQVASPGWRPSERRIIMYTDAAAINDATNGPCVAGAAVSYQLMLTGSASSWMDASYSIIGTNDSTKAELYAIGSALDLAAREMQTLGAGRKALLPTVHVLSDSKSSLYYIHDFAWQNATPRILSPTDFARYLSRPLSQLRDLGVLVEFHWVPGHAMVAGNCRADAAAGAASRYTISRYPEALYKKLSSCHVVRIVEDPPVPSQHARNLVSYGRVGPQRRSSISYAYEIQADRIRALQTTLKPVEPETRNLSRVHYDETFVACE